MRHFFILGAVLAASASCGGTTTIGHGRGDVTTTDGGSGEQGAGGTGVGGQVGEVGGQTGPSPADGGSGNGVGGTPSGTGASTGSAGSAGAPQCGNLADCPAPTRDQCSCVDPTSPLTTLSACESACSANQLALCNWGNYFCRPQGAGQGCVCSPVGTRLPGPGGGTCSLIGPWHTHSSPWNGLSTDATITFNTDGTLTGVPSFAGTWSLHGDKVGESTDGTTLTISNTTGQDMGCAGADEWTVTFYPDCDTAPLVPIGSDCTGARRYLDWDVTLTRL